jgi:hypothetical protein
MDEIKPTAGFGPINHRSADSTADAKPTRNFSVTAGNETTSSPETAATSSTKPQFTKADLQDPAKLNHIVRSCVSDIVDANTGSLPVSSTDKQALTDFLSEDPLFRQRVESYLRKALP